MMSIDWTHVVTVEARAATAQAGNILAGRAECARRIVAVARETTQLNLAAAAAAGLLDEADFATYRQGLIWIAEMRATWRPLAESGADLSDDALWPVPPAPVVALARKY